MFKSIRSAAADRTLFIGGPYEFISDDGDDHAVEASFAPLARAYEALRYSVGALSQAEAAKFQSLGATPPKGWVVLDSKEPRSGTFTVGGHKVGIIYFPEGKKSGDLPSKDVFVQIDRAVTALRPQVELLIGVSPWGETASNDYLRNAHPDLDILLSAGLGVGFPAKPAADGKVLWSHAFFKGKALYTIDLLAWPGAKGTQWVEGKNFSTKTIGLDDSFAADPDMQQLLQGVRDPGEKP